MQNNIVSGHADEERKLILIVEDEFVSREMLRNAIKDDYDLLLAATGREAVEHIRNNGNRISLILLDLNLPDMSGMEILSRLREKEDQYTIPVIVLTADVDAEVDSLDLGAADFIPKPYPRVKVIKARIRRTIELSEKRFIIGRTEHDSLTGLYNREFFFHYARQLDRREPDAEMDAMVVNVNHFHVMNERYGKNFSNAVLKHIGEKLAILTEDGGLASRRYADRFLVYLPHRDDYESILAELSEGISGGGNDDTVRLRLGVYPLADKNIELESRFERATAASDLAKNRLNDPIGIYDSEQLEKNRLSEQLTLAFPEAIKESQFTVYYQPKFRITGDKPVLASAEALVRWIHPELGFISPGTFIPTFEANGLIGMLDNYVWEAAAGQIRDWKDRFGVSVPVSVNVSRADLFDPDICGTFRKIANESGISCSELMLEVTESSYAEDSEHIIRTVKQLREEGFLIEMDDFGSGYSSLNMLTSLPIDALKMDMQFIRTAFSPGGETGILGIVIDIARFLGVPVIAEGVETEEQMLTLKEMGCDIVQGYYFSKPLPAEEFERFLTEEI